MKITISIPDELYDKLEADRGLIPRSTYIQELIENASGVAQSDSKDDEPEDEGNEPKEHKNYLNKDEVR